MLQPGFEKKVMHSSFRIRGIQIMASDGCDDKNKFDEMRLALAVPTEEDARQYFDALSNRGKVEMPMVKTFWSPWIERNYRLVSPTRQRGNLTLTSLAGASG